MEAEPKPNITTLIEQTGFRETPELSNLRRQIVDGLLTLREIYPLPAHILHLRTNYQIRAEEIIDQLLPEDFAKAQIGLIIAQAKMFQDARWNNRFLAEIQDALTYAENMGFDDIAQTLRAIQSNPPSSV